MAGLRINTPHIMCPVVMPGHIGTFIALNARKIHGNNGLDVMNAPEIAQAHARFTSTGSDATTLFRRRRPALMYTRHHRGLLDALYGIGPWHLAKPATAVPATPRPPA